MGFECVNVRGTDLPSTSDAADVTCSSYCAMGKGGPLAFLNKKHFHTGSIRNVEEVWKREQKAAREEARLEELQKQIAQERQLEELEQVAEKAGHARHDVMYFLPPLTKRCSCVDHKIDWTGCMGAVW